MFSQHPNFFQKWASIGQLDTLLTKTVVGIITLSFGHSFQGAEEDWDGNQDKKSLLNNNKKKTSGTPKQVESYDIQNVMEKIDVLEEKMTTLNQLSIEETVLASIVLICGNNYMKTKLLCEALNLKVSHAFFLNFQRSCITPVFEEVWSGMNELVEKLLRNQVEHCLCTAGARNSFKQCIARYCDSTL